MLIGAWQPGGLRVDVEHLFAPVAEPPRAEMARVKAEGRRLLVTVEPWTWPERHEVRAWHRALADHRQEVWVRFAHEFNGDWYPWGDDRAAFLDGWHDFFGGCPPNVKRVWSPNVGWNGATMAFGRWWPDGDTPDIVGLDGYQWQPTDTAGAVFGASIRELREISGGPLLICETAAPAPARRQQDWIRGLKRELRNAGDVLGVVWFNEAKEEQWTLTGRAKRSFTMLGTG